MQSSIFAGTLEYLRRPFTSNVKPGDQVLIVTDTRQDPRVWQAVLTIVAELRAEGQVALFEPRPADYLDPPRTVCEAMLKSDVNVLLASTAMYHADAATAAMAAGVPSICMDGGMTLEMFQTGGATADYKEIAYLKRSVALRVYGPTAREVRVTSKYGTDLTYSVAGRVFVPPLHNEDWDPFKAYKRTEEGRKGSPLYGCVFPTGEFNVPPVEGTGEGTLVVDLTMHHLGRIVEPVALTVKRGRITEINGGAQAWQLRAYLAEHGDENSYVFPTEASIGLNTKARVTGIQREDKNIWGCMHFGLGTNSDVGGTVKSRLHMDLVILQPTLYVDGEKRLEGGSFAVDLS